MNEQATKSIIVISNRKEKVEEYKALFGVFEKSLSCSVDVRIGLSQGETGSVLKVLLSASDAKDGKPEIGLLVIETGDPEQIYLEFSELGMPVPCIIITENASSPIWKEDTIVILPQTVSSAEIVLYADLVMKFFKVNEERNFLRHELVETQKTLSELTADFKRKITEQATALMMPEKMASMGLLAAGIAHEVNSPVSSINGNLFAIEARLSELEALLSLYERLKHETEFGVDTSETCRLIEVKGGRSAEALVHGIKDFIDEIRASVSQIMMVISGLLSFSRVNSMDRGFYDITSVLEESIAKTPGLSQGDGIELVRSYSNTPEVPCYREKLIIAFVNILTNAVQAIRKTGTITVDIRQIETGRRNEDEFVQVQIRDTGCGISLHDLPHIFDPFFTTRTSGEGNGLGLSIVYDIVRAHGGTVQIDSIEGKGTTCTVKLPLKIPLKLQEKR